MQIKYLGHASFLIRTKQGRLVTDPFDPKMVGLKSPRVEADAVTVSHQHGDHNYAAAVSGEPVVFDWPGEYEKNGIRVFGYKSFHDEKKGAERGENILFKIEAEEINILHCGDMGVLPDQTLLDEISDIDVLMVPVGGFFTIGSEEAEKLVKLIEPAIVIPMHYQVPGLSPQIKEKLAPVSEFLKLFGVSAGEETDTLDLKKEELQSEMKIVVLKSRV